MNRGIFPFARKEQRRRGIQPSGRVREEESEESKVRDETRRGSQNAANPAVEVKIITNGTIARAASGPAARNAVDRPAVAADRSKPRCRCKLIEQTS